MQYSSAQYAEALHTLTDGATDTEAAKICDQFVVCLEGAGQKHLLKSILNAYRAILTKKNAQPEVVVRSAQKISPEKLDEIFTSLDIEKGRPVKEVIDAGMIGGVFVKDNNQAYDLSLKRRLARLGQKLQNS